MAAGRPALAPPHTGMADSIDEQCGFTLASHPEPAAWPQEIDGGYRTTWHRLVWQSLHDQLRASHETAWQGRVRYQTLANRARERMRELASADSVWPRLAAALNSVSVGWAESSRPTGENRVGLEGSTLPTILSTPNSERRQAV